MTELSTKTNTAERRIGAQRDIVETIVDLLVREK
jgi:hypothetical protein